MGDDRGWSLPDRPRLAVGVSPLAALNCGKVGHEARPTQRPPVAEVGSVPVAVAVVGIVAPVAC